MARPLLIPSPENATIEELKQVSQVGSAVKAFMLKRINVDKRKRGRTARSMWRWMKRRAAIEPGIGHLKREHRMWIATD